MDTLKIVNCPFCKGVLYTLAPDPSGAKPNWRLTQDSPLIKTDKQGSFMKCPRCAKRIGLRMAG